MGKPKPGKYDHVTPTLPKLPVESAPYQARVDEMKRTCQHCKVVDPPEDEACPMAFEFGDRHLVFARLDPVKLVKAYAQLRREKDEQERAEKALNLRIEAATQLLVASQDRGDDAWGQYGVKDNAIRLPTGDTVRVESVPYGQVKDKEAFRVWCVANGYERQLQLWPTTMQAIVKERAAAGDPYPDGTECFRKETVKLTGAGLGEGE